jgi:BlaI family penicillinase repressor
MAADSMVAGTSRHSILDLAPLELDCMNALWPLGEATVRHVRESLRPTRPRAYTTIMTILDRLAQKGVVQRRKVGRAWVYSANVSADQARAHAVAQVVEGFFGGSTGALASHLSAQSAPDPESKLNRFVTAPLDMLAAAEMPERRRPSPSAEAPGPVSPQPSEPANLDAALL